MTFLGLFVFILIANVGIFWLSIQQVIDQQRLVTHSNEVRRTLSEVMNLANQAEAGHRGYVITGDRDYLASVKDCESEAYEQLRKFRALTVDNPEQQANADELERRLDARFAAIRDALELMRTRGPEAVRSLLREGHGLNEIVAVRTLVAQMDRNEEVLLEQREPAATRSYRIAVYSSLIGALAGFALVGMSYRRLTLDTAFRVRAADALQQQREWFQITLASVGDAVITCELDGSINYLNPVAERLTGWTVDEAEGSQLDRVCSTVLEDTREPHAVPIERVLSAGTSIDIVNRIILIARDGVERPIDLSSAPIVHVSGMTIGVVVVFRDTTEQRRLDRERRDALHREQDARRRAEEANRVKDEFVGMVSHELRTPLNAILGWSHVLQLGENSDETVERALATIDRNARAQAKLIEDLLDISRMAAGLMHLDIGMLDPGTMVLHAIETLQPAAAAKGVRILTSIEPDLRTIEGDTQRLQQVIENLLTNAVKFTERGGTVEVVLSKVDSCVEIRVRDTGRGIDPDFLPSVFDRFRQADASSSRSSSGLGLGLAIAQQLVELHGGSIEAYSAGEGLGSTFTVRLPASSQSAALEAVGTTGSAGSAESPATISTLGREKLEGVRVVVVDDEREVLEMSAFLLTQQGADVRTASSASAALDLVKTWRPDCIVSDIGMPGQDGYEFIKSVRSLSDKSGGAIPAVAVTAYVRPEDREKALASGFQMHLAKPVDPAELVAVIQSLTGAAGRATGDGSPGARRDSSRIL